MTDQSEVENGIAYKLLRTNLSKHTPLFEEVLDIVKHEIEIAVLEARIEELANALYIAGQDNGDIKYKNRYSSFQSRLAELRNNE